TTSATLNESGKRPSVENTSGRKKAKRALHELPMLKKLIEELKASPSADHDISIS
ncbi:6001_t:CDS:1, partial [Funneliformis caledonium]